MSRPFNPGDKVTIDTNPKLQSDDWSRDWARVEYEEMGLSYPDEVATVESCTFKELDLWRRAWIVNLKGGRYDIDAGHFKKVEDEDD